MDLILNKFWRWFWTWLLRDHQKRLNYYKEYLPVFQKKEETKLLKKLHKIDLLLEKLNLKYAIYQHVDNDLVQKYYAYELDKLTKSNSLSKRAFQQKMLRYSGSKRIEHPQKQEMEKKIELRFEKQKADLKTSYFQASPVLFQETFEALLTKRIEWLIKHQSTLTGRSQKHVKSKVKKYESRLVQIQKNIDTFTLKLKELSGFNPYEAMLDEDTLLKLDGLSMHFGGLKAVDNLSFEVKKGSIFGLIGPNGAGKTTVFNCITRFYKATHGKVYYRNQSNEVICLNDYLVHNVIKEGIVRTFQNVELIWELNVIDNLLVAAHTIYRSSFFGHLFNSRVLRHEEMILREKAIKILIDLGLQDYMYMYPLGLPYGILKKVELARTLMANPKLIILDEPAAGLNDAETENLAETIKKIRDEYHTTIFLVEHDMGLVMDICDTICAISFGKKLALGTPKEIQSSAVVREAYLGGE